jgi:beta-glucosidase-like glycosyl hydrolase
LKGAPVYADSDEKAAAFALNNGTDLEMGSRMYTNHLTLAVHLGLTSEAAVDAAIKRL